MESMETQLLNKYNITSLYPTVWPSEKDENGDNSDDDGPPDAIPNSRVSAMQRRKSRFSVLEGGSGWSKKRDGVEKSKDGVENLVQKDEGDPLGVYPSVVQVLRQRGLGVEDDVKMRNRFLLSSTTFSPALFLSQVHNQASTDSLLQGLEFLSRSIEKKSASLKVLVEANFERFVGAKATIDRVYNEMRDVGTEPEPVSPGKKPAHSRGASRSSFSVRQVSASLTPGTLGAKVDEKKKKNALVKESEYGVHGIKVPLTEVAVKAEEVWGPALGGREKEETLKLILSSVEKNRGLFEVGSAIQDGIRRKDHETIVEEYTRARKFAEDARYIVEQANYSKTPLSDVEVNQIIVTARMWADVEHQVEAFKRDAWKRLTSTHFRNSQILGQSSAEDDKSEQYMEIISIMLELGVEDNPIWIWLLSRYEYLKSRVATTCERIQVEVEVLRRHLANSPKPGLKLLQKHMRAVPTSKNVVAEPAKLDAPKVIEFWEHMHASMNALLGISGGLLGELVEYWEIVQSFIEGRVQRSLPMGFNNQSSVHHTLSPGNIKELEQGLTDLIIEIKEVLNSFFAEPPIEDISVLFSPLPPNSPTPTTPRTPMSTSAMLSPTMGSRFRLDPNNVPPPSPGRGEAWEKYAFWAPNANALSGSHYLAKILNLIGTAGNELASLRLEYIDNPPDNELRTLVNTVRERCLAAVCAAWNTDAENIKVLEDWTRHDDRKDITTMPSRFLAVQSFLLNNLQKILYIEASTKTSVDVILPPSSKFLSMVRSQFQTSLFRTLSGMYELADRGRVALGREFEIKDDDLAVNEEEAEDGSWGKVDATKRSIRLLLTLSNMSSFQTEITPQLLTLFETLYSVQLPDETNRLRDVLTQLDTKLFSQYTNYHSSRIDRTINAGINSPTWAPAPEPGKSPADRDPSPYVFTVLLDLVIVHTEVSTTSPPLTSRILRALFEATTTSLINTFQQLESCDLNRLMQATLDVEFMAQTLAAFTTERASQVQTDIYQVLDQKTDNAARVRLQEELGALRGVLKRLREGTRVEFACFRGRKREGERRG